MTRADTMRALSAEAADNALGMLSVILYIIADMDLDDVTARADVAVRLTGMGGARGDGSPRSEAERRIIGDAIKALR